jgi:pyrimidine operon attenuation protein / uracil phosphoribosyltransferase
MPTAERHALMDASAVRRALARMAREIVERNDGIEGLVLMGVRRRGDHLAALLREEIRVAEGSEVPVGVLDITLYRDDLATVGPRPVVGETQLPADGIEGRTVVLVDDVLYTGRTVRAALNELMDWGRPARILLCVLADRGGRELPIQPDVVGRSVEVVGEQRVEVLVPDLDGRLAVDLVNPAEAGR